MHNHNKKFLTIFLWGLLLLYVFTATRYINYPGLHYDEMLFVNAALGGIDDSFIVERIGNIPVYLCTYIGALKAYLYYPIFAFFEVSAASVRLPMILLTAVSFFVLFLAVKRAFGRKTAWIAFLLLIFSPSIMFHTRTDNGPTCLQFFLVSICLYLTFEIYSTRRKLLLVLLYFTCWVGIYNNIKFIWFINSLIFASLFLYLDIIYKKVRNRGTGFFLKGLFVFTLSYFPFIIYSIILSRRMAYPLVTKKYSGLLKLKNIFNEIQGDGYYELALGTLANPMENPYLILVAALLSAGAFIVFFAGSSNLQKKKMLFLWVMLITTVLQILITPQARKIWHAFKIYPWITILLAVCLLAVSGYLQKINTRLGSVFTVVVLVLLVGYNTMLTGQYLKALRDHKSNPYWSEVIYDLVDYTREEKGRFFSCTWGIHNQLISFHKDPYRFQEIFPLLRCDMTEQEQETFYTGYLKEHNAENYFILRPIEGNFYKEVRENLFKTAQKYGVKLIEHRRFRDTSDNRDIFILYRPQQQSDKNKNNRSLH